MADCCLTLFASSVLLLVHTSSYWSNNRVKRMAEMLCDNSFIGGVVSKDVIIIFGVALSTTFGQQQETSSHPIFPCKCKGTSIQTSNIVASP